MSSPEVLDEQAVTENLPLELKLEVERRVIELCNALGDVAAKEWIDRFNEGLHEVMQTKEEVKDLARQGLIEKAAIAAKQELEKYYGHNVTL